MLIKVGKCGFVAVNYLRRVSILVLVGYFIPYDLIVMDVVFHSIYHLTDLVLKETLKLRKLFN